MVPAGSKMVEMKVSTEVAVSERRVRKSLSTSVSSAVMSEFLRAKPSPVTMRRQSAPMLMRSLGERRVLLLRSYFYSAPCESCER